jgi:hypothetical protein
LLATEMLPASVPAIAGANFTLSVAVWFVFKVKGAVTPLTLKPLPAAVMLLICTATVPVFVSVIF